MFINQNSTLVCFWLYPVNKYRVVRQWWIVRKPPETSAEDSGWFLNFLLIEKSGNLPETSVEVSVSGGFRTIDGPHGIYLAVWMIFLVFLDQLFGLPQNASPDSFSTPVSWWKTADSPRSMSLFYVKITTDSSSFFFSFKNIKKGEHLAFIIDIFW